MSGSSARSALDGTTRRLSRRDLLRMAALSTGALAAAPLLNACSTDAGTGASGATTGVLSYMSTSTAKTDLAWFEKVVAAIESEHPGVTVEGQQLDADQAFYPQIQTMVATGAYVDVLPDISESLWRDLANEGLLADAGEVLAALGGPSGFRPGMLDRVTIEGTPYGVPLRIGGFLMWYRTDLAEAAGLSAPTSWASLREYMSATTTADMYGNGIPYGVNNATSGALFSYILANGGNVCDPNLDVVFDSPANVETLEYLRDIAQFAPPGYLNYGYAETLENFVQGRASTCYYVGRILERINTDNPALADKIGVVRIPAAGGGEPVAAYGSFAISAMLKEAPNPTLGKLWQTDYQFATPYYIDALLGAPGNDYPTLQLSAEEEARYEADPLLNKYADILEITMAAAEAAVSPSQESAAHQPNPRGGVILAGPILPTVLQEVVTGTKPAAAAVADAAAALRDVMTTG